MKKFHVMEKGEKYENDLKFVFESFSNGISRVVNMKYAQNIRLKC